jgi:hypothetical protein
MAENRSLKAEQRGTGGFLTLLSSRLFFLFLCTEKQSHQQTVFQHRDGFSQVRDNLVTSRGSKL